MSLFWVSSIECCYSEFYYVECHYFEFQVYWVLLLWASVVLNVVYWGCYCELHYAKCLYAKCHYSECHFAKCHYAECRSAERRGAIKTKEMVLRGQGKFFSLLQNWFECLASFGLPVNFKIVSHFFSSARLQSANERIPGCPTTLASCKKMPCR